MTVKRIIAGVALVSLTAIDAGAADLTSQEQLGKSIFFDENLSLNNNQSCASCHAPEAGWTGPLSGVNAGTVVYEGSIPGSFGNRKPPSSAYATTSPILHLDAKAGLFVGGNFWDGRAGEKLGFLPGDIAEKVNPYLRPLYDALFDMVDYEKATVFMERGTVEVAPLAFMRGRTLNDSFIILDEAQNTSPEQMKMFLTRLGFGSKIVVTGDVTQVDLPTGVRSGLRIVESILDGIEDVSFNRLTAHDVVRHKLVGRIVAAYDEHDARAEQLRAMRSGSPE